MVNKIQQTILTKESLNARIANIPFGHWRNNKNEVIVLKDQPLTYLNNIYRMILRSAESIMHDNIMDSGLLKKIHTITFPPTSRDAVLIYTPLLYDLLIEIEKLIKLKGGKHLIISKFIDPAP